MSTTRIGTLSLLLLAACAGGLATAPRDPLAGTLRLGMIPTVGPYLSPLILPALRRELPDLSITLVEGITEHLEARLLEGDLDAAILATGQGDERLVEQPLYTEPFLLALPDDDRLADSDSVLLLPGQRLCSLIFCLPTNLPEILTVFPDRK